MFKITALLTTLALGSTASIAMASPTRYDRDRAYDGPGRFDRQYRHWDRRAALDDVGPRRYRQTWIALSAPSPITRAADCIEVHDRGTFTQLRVQADGARALVDRVVVQFADGSRQIEDLDRVLGGRSDFVDIPLDGNNRRIDRIIVTGATGRRSALQVFGI